MKYILLLLNAGKLGKALTSAGSMVLSIATYSLVFGWPFAAGFVGLLLAHELGHYFAARQRGLPAGLPFFIPFVGAWIALKDVPRDVETEAYVAFAGPFIGTLAAFAVYYLGREMDSRLLIALSYAGFMLNLFNLIPLSPLDGGRITAVLTPRIWFLGLPVLISVWFYRPSPMLVLIGVLAIPQLIQAWRYDPADPANQAYYGIRMETRIEYTVLYLGLAVVLALMMQSVHAQLTGAPVG